MKLNVYAVRDNGTEAYMQPFYAHNHYVAKRMIQASANDEGTLLYNHPGDFAVFWIGYYDDQKGELEPLGHTVNLGKVVDIMGENHEK